MVFDGLGQPMDWLNSILALSGGEDMFWLSLATDSLSLKTRVLILGRLSIDWLAATALPVHCISRYLRIGPLNTMVMSPIKTQMEQAIIERNELLFFIKTVQNYTYCRNQRITP